MGSWTKQYDNIEHSLSLATRGYQEASKLNNKEYTHKFKSCIATYYQVKGEYEKSIQAFEEDLAYCKNLNREAWLSHTYSNLANTYFLQGESQKAIEANIKALDILKKLKKSYGNVYGTIGAIYAQMDDLAQCKKYIYLALQDTALIIGERLNLYTNISNIYSEEKKKDSALYFLIQTEKLLNRHKEKNSQLSMNYYLAKAEYENHFNTYSSNLDYAYDGLNIAQASGSTRAIAQLTNVLAKAYIKKGILDSAKKYATQSKDLNLGVADLYMLNSNFKDLSLIAEREGKKDSSLFFLKEAVRWEDSFDVIQISQDARNAEMRYQTKQKDEQNAFLLEKNKLETKQKKWVLYGGISIASILSLFLFNVIRGQKRLRIANKTIELQKEDLATSNQIKDKIFGIISHELRSPIANLSSLVQLKNTMNVDDSRLKELDIKIGQSLQSTSMQLDNLLLWSMQQIKGRGIDIQVHSVTDMIENQVQFLKPLADSKQIDIQVNIVEHFLETDKNGFELIIRNLLNNAIKFTPQKGIIEIASNHDNVFSIQDSGEGMTEKQIAEFKNKSLSSTRGTSNETGTGLGLLLVLDYAAMLGIEIDIQNRNGNYVQLKKLS
jgi:signal transduction histidine kinase